MTESSNRSNETPHERFKRLFAEAQARGKERPSPPNISETAPRPAQDTPAVRREEARPPERRQPPPAEETERMEAAPSPAPQGMGDFTEIIPAGEPTPPPLGRIPQVAPPALGTAGLPTPRRVDEIDPNATRVGPSAYASPPASAVRPPAAAPTRRAQPPAGQAYTRPPAERTTVHARTTAPDGGDQNGRKASRSCLVRLGIFAFFGIAVLGIILLTVLVYQYLAIASTLPEIGELRERASQFETTRIFDSKGNLLYEIIDPNAGRRTYVPLEKMSPYLIAATIATEDKNYYSHGGYNPLAILRAFWSNTTSGEIVSGASTITQQLGRILMFSPEERTEQTYTRKLREAILAAEITRRYTKDEILELYLNEIHFGNLAYGVEAAAQTYFGTNAGNLNLEQSALLAGLPQLPYVYDVYTNREAAMQRTEQVLYLMFETSREQGCIYVGNNIQPVCVDAVQATQAMEAIKAYTFEKNDVQMERPHWVNFIRSLLEEKYDPQTIYRSGFSVYTTLDPELQDAAERIVSQQVAALQGMNASGGALVAIRPTTGEILAMVGSPDYYGSAKDAQVNMAVSPRQPGSSIKPITYMAAFEKGWTPATLIWDVPTEFPPSGKADDPNPPYVPVNYDGWFHGPVTVRYALANSYNIPAVKALQYVGIYGDATKPGESGLVGMAERLGITTLTRKDYGLSLGLGGGEIPLVEMTGAFSVFANGGRRVPPIAITRIVDYNGEEVYRYEPPAGDIVLRPEHTYWLSSILSDNAARSAAFGYDSDLNLPFPAAVKTGTTNDFRDNWTIGYTPDLTVGVWVGNPDYTPMINTTGVTGAAPIWSAFMQVAVPQVTGGNLSNFVRPAEVIDEEVCAISGTKPSQWCPETRSEIFSNSQRPLPKEQDLWQEAFIDTWTGLLASRECADYAEMTAVLNVTDVWAVKWLKEGGGKDWLDQMGLDEAVITSPDRQCKSSDSRPNISFAFPKDGETVKVNPVDVYASVGATSDFSDYALFYGLGSEPEEWRLLAQGGDQYQNPQKLASWDVGELPAGEAWLRLLIRSTRKTYAEKKVHINLQAPTPTASPTGTFTATPSPTEPPPPTPLPSETPQPTFTTAPSATQEPPPPTETQSIPPVTPGGMPAEMRDPLAAQAETDGATCWSQTQTVAGASNHTAVKAASSCG